MQVLAAGTAEPAGAQEVLAGRPSETKRHKKVAKTKTQAQSESNMTFQSPKVLRRRPATATAEPAGAQEVVAGRPRTPLRRVLWILTRGWAHFRECTNRIRIASATCFFHTCGKGSGLFGERGSPAVDSIRVSRVSVESAADPSGDARPAEGSLAVPAPLPKRLQLRLPSAARLWPAAWSLATTAVEFAHTRRQIPLI